MARGSRRFGVVAAVRLIVPALPGGCELKCETDNDAKCTVEKVGDKVEKIVDKVTKV